MTQYYIGTKRIQAWPEQRAKEDGSGYADGYAIKYPDGYISWSPKDVFEKAYLPMGEDNDGSKITQQMVDDFIMPAPIVQTVGPKTTVVQATLRNGFVITESSTCVDPANYNEDLGKKICMERIKNKVWELLGFLLQSARTGLSVPAAVDVGLGQDETVVTRIAPSAEDTTISEAMDESTGQQAEPVPGAEAAAAE